MLSVVFALCMSTLWVRGATSGLPRDDAVCSLQTASNIRGEIIQVGTTELSVSANSTAAERLQNFNGDGTTATCSGTAAIHMFSVSYAQRAVTGGVRYTYTLTPTPAPKNAAGISHINFEFDQCTCEGPNQFSDLEMLEYAEGSTRRGGPVRIPITEECGPKGKGAKTHLKFDSVGDKKGKTYTVSFTIADDNLGTEDVNMIIKAGPTYYSGAICGPVCRPPSPTQAATPSPTDLPTPTPTDAPTASPTNFPTSSPTKAPTTSPTSFPTSSPTGAPTASPTGFPTSSPTDAPTASPTGFPTSSPTDAPTASPTGFPTSSPTDAPTASPTSFPTSSPTDAPTASPTGFPTSSPTDAPTASPTSFPTLSPTDAPTASPTSFPTSSPTDTSAAPTSSPTDAPTSSPTGNTATTFGDPHVSNVKGERFNILQPDYHTFLVIPRGADKDQALLYVLAKVDHLGPLCNGLLYVTALEFSGLWVGKAGSLEFSTALHANMDAEQAVKMRVGSSPYLTLSEFKTIVNRSVVPEATAFQPTAPQLVNQRVDTLLVKLQLGPTSAKVRMVHQKEREGFSNSFWLTTTGLQYANREIGGILGLDSHKFAASLPAQCMDGVHDHDDDGYRMNSQLHSIHSVAALGNIE